MSFDVLQEKIIAKQNPTVAGLDARIEYVPEHIRKAAFAQYGVGLKGACEAIWQFNVGLIDALCDVVPAVKPQSAYYENLGWQGMEMLERTIRYAREKGLFVIADIKRGKADVAAIKTAMKYLKDGELLLMFPEGTRHQDGEFGDAKTGAAMLALRTGVPIIPIYLPAEKKWFRWNPVVFGEAYYPKAPEGRKPTPEDYHAVADDLMERIEALKPQAGR